MRVPQEKREPYAVHFVSANKHTTVLSQIQRTSYTILHKISQIRIFLDFANFRKYAKFLARSIYNIGESLNVADFCFCVGLRAQSENPYCCVSSLG